jgi:hypothetical protein
MNAQAKGGLTVVTRKSVAATIMFAFLVNFLTVADLQAQAGSLAGLPCKKVLAGSVRGDDACVRIGGLYLWRRLAGNPAPAPAPVATAAPSVVPVGLTSTRVATLPDPCALLAPEDLSSHAVAIRADTKAPVVESSTGTLRTCFFPFTLNYGYGDIRLSTSRVGQRGYDDDRRPKAEYLQFDSDLYVYQSGGSYSSEYSMFTERNGVRLYTSGTITVANISILEMQRMFRLAAARFNPA